jgi:hypothetical protein
MAISEVLAGLNNDNLQRLQHSVLRELFIAYPDVARRAWRGKWMTTLTTKVHVNSYGNREHL